MRALFITLLLLTNCIQAAHKKPKPLTDKQVQKQLQSVAQNIITPNQTLRGITLEQIHITGRGIMYQYTIDTKQIAIDNYKSFTNTTTSSLKDYYCNNSANAWARDNDVDMVFYYQTNQNTPYCVIVASPAWCTDSH